MDAGNTCTLAAAALVDTAPEFGGESLGVGDNSANSLVRSASSISFSFRRRRMGTILQALAANIPTLVTVEITRKAIWSPFTGKSHTIIVGRERFSSADLVHSWMDWIK
jgi:hypothetical protein